VLKNLKFPLLYAAEALLFVPLLAGFVGIVAFWDAQPLGMLNLQGKSLPATWEAAIPNHGKFLPGYLIANHPIVFASVIALHLGSAAILFRIHKAQALQRKRETSVGETAHKIAQGSVFAVWAVIIYILVTRVLVGVSPA
jgi:hypothetical protein